VSLNKVLKFANIISAILLFASLGLVYWFVYRPLPQLSGTVRAPLSGEARVGRDAIGVPHVSAANIDDALFLQGYVTAQDRLWQMDLLRRIGAAY
jgi:penicillin amidase